MGEISTTANVVFRDNDGGSPHYPEKPAIRGLFVKVDAAVTGAVGEAANYAVRSEDALRQIEDLASGSPTAPSILNKAEAYTPERFGAVGYATTDASAPDETAEVQDMLYGVSLGQTIVLRESYLTDSFQNPSAARFDGPGEILTETSNGSPSIEGGFALLNWNNDADRDIFGEEYLYPLRKVLESPAYADRIIKGFAYGDSTLDQDGATTSDPVNLIQNALPSLAQTIGLPGTFQIVNEAKSGTDMSDAVAGNTRLGSTPLENLGPENHLSIFKFGLNEGLAATKSLRPASISTAISDWVSVYNDAFFAIRNAPYGDIESHAIIVIGPNSASNIGYQDQRWIKKWIIALKRLCRQYQVAYFDTYSRWADSLTGGEKWLDGPATYGPLHPTDTGWASIWSAFGDFLRVALVTDGGQTNRLVNVTSAVATPAASAPPSNFRPGVSIYRVSDATGWFAPAKLTVTVSADNDCHTQTLELVSANRSFTRRKLSGSDAWGPFSNIDTAIPLSNGWVNFGSGNADAQCRVSTDGVVHLAGLIKSGTATSETVVGVLPAGFRPAATERFIAATAGGAAVAMRIEASGNIVIDGGTASSAFLSLSGITFCV